MALHTFINGICTTCEPTMRRFDPAEPRDPHSGKWGIGSEVVKAIAGLVGKDSLKIRDQIDLKPGERFEGSRSMDGQSGAVGFAWTRRHDGQHLRLGSLDDEGEWTAGDDGFTAELDEHGIASLRSSLHDMQQSGAQAGRRTQEGPTRTWQSAVRASGT